MNSLPRVAWAPWIGATVIVPLDCVGEAGSFGVTDDTTRGGGGGVFNLAILALAIVANSPFGYLCKYSSSNAGSFSSFTEFQKASSTAMSLCCCGLGSPAAGIEGVDSTAGLK